MFLSRRADSFGLNSRPTQKILSELEKFPGTFYVNVNNADAFVISMIYSKASIFFLCLIGTMTAVNTLTFSTQLTETNVLCRLNDLLPIGRDLRQIVIPIVYYCRFLEMSIAVNVLQLVFCLFALLCALNRRSYFFLLCYSFLGLMLLLGSIFLIFILSLNFEDYIRHAVEQMLGWVLNSDSSFCQVLEPVLNCRIYPTPDDIARQQFRILNESESVQHPSSPLIHTTINENSDAIEYVCGMARNRTSSGSLISSTECSVYLTSFLMQRRWLIGLVVEYGVVIVAAIIAIVYAFRKNRRQRNPTTGSCKTVISDLQCNLESTSVTDGVTPSQTANSRDQFHMGTGLLAGTERSFYTNEDDDPTKLMREYDRNEKQQNEMAQKIS